MIRFRKLSVKELLIQQTLKLSSTVEFTDSAKMPWIIVPNNLASAKPGAASPDFDLFIDDGAGSTGVSAWAFDNSIEQSLYYNVMVPYDWNEGSSIEVAIRWAPLTAGAGDVVWKLEFGWQNLDTAFTTTSEISVTDTAAGVAKQHQEASFGLIPGTGLERGSLGVVRIFRDATNVADTLATDAFALFTYFKYQASQYGADS